MDTEEAIVTNYIDDIARLIATEAADQFSGEARTLYRIYAVLCLAKGADTTAEDVHDAWSAWMAGLTPDHRSLIPFSDLTAIVAELDELYRDAIHAVARARFPDTPQGS